MKVEEKDVPAGFMAYKYTEELNDSLIGQKQELPYGFCHKDNIFLTINDNVVEGKSVFHRYQCGTGSKCNSDYEGLCIFDDVSIDVKTTFMCDAAPKSMKNTAFVIKYDGKTTATCPAGTKLKIKNENGIWSNVKCGSQTFTLDKVRCAPIKLSNDGSIPLPKP